MARWNYLTKRESFLPIWHGAGTITKNNFLLRANKQYVDGEGDAVPRTPVNSVVERSGNR